jgi:hypothetical protein
MQYSTKRKQCCAEQPVEKRVVVGLVVGECYQHGHCPLNTSLIASSHIPPHPPNGANVPQSLFKNVDEHFGETCRSVQAQRYATQQMFKQTEQTPDLAKD